MKEDDVVDLEQFREAIYSWRADAIRRGGNSMCTERAYYLMAKRIEEADRLLSIIDNAGGVECAEPVAWQRRYAHQLPAGGLCAWREITRDEYEAAVSAEYPDRAYEYRVLYTAPQQPAAVVDEAMVDRALNAKVRNWPVRQLFDSECDARIAMRAALTVALSPRQPCSHA